MDTGKHPLKLYRDRTGETLEQVAVRVAVTAATISRIERGKLTPRMTLAGKLSAVTGIPLDQFLPPAKAEAAA